MDGQFPKISPDDLYAPLGTGRVPVEVCRRDTFNSDSRLIVGADNQEDKQKGCGAVNVAPRDPVFRFKVRMIVGGMLCRPYRAIRVGRSRERSPRAAQIGEVHSSFHEPKKERGMRVSSALLFSGAVLASTAAACAQDIDWQQVDAEFGRKAAVSVDVHRYGFPRTDLTVTLDGVTIKPALALGGWVAFKPMHGEVMLMGDVVLLETEINPVMAKLIENGIEITAVHNHLLRAKPAPFYMHVGGHGDPVKLANAIRAALAESNTPLEVLPTTGPAPAIDLDIGQLDHIVRVKGQRNGGVYQFAVPRRDPIVEDGMAITPAGPMGVATAINFQPTGGGKAAVTGDFVLTGDEVNPVIKTLRENGIEVTAVHSHMLREQPRLFFMHFWANDDAVKLANGLRAALEKTAIAKD